MGVYLEDNPPARAQWSARTAKPTGAIVVHTAECAADPVGPDTAAEGIASFIRRRSDPGSYHTVVDSDSIVRLGRFEWAMYGEGTGGNKWALHLSFACMTESWTSQPAPWVANMLWNGVRGAVEMAQWMRGTHGVIVPARRITNAEYRAGAAGFISHADVDPHRRSDPGANFPWSVFLPQFDSAFNEEDPMAIAELEARMDKLEQLVEIAFNVLPYADNHYDIIKGLYRVVLKREPDDQGFLYWVGQMEKGVPLLSIVREFLAVAH